MGRALALLRAVLQRKRCCLFSPRLHCTSARNGGAWHRSNTGGALQGYRQLNLWQGTWQRWHPARPDQAWQKHPSADPSWRPLPMLERENLTTRHERCQDCHPVQEQGGTKWLHQLQRHIPPEHRRQTLRPICAHAPAEAGRACLPWVLMWLPCRTLNCWHDLLRPPTAGEMQSTAKALVCRLRRPHQSVWPGQQGRALQHRADNRMPKKTTQND